MNEREQNGRLTVKDWILSCPGGEGFAHAIDAVVAERRASAPLDEGTIRGLATVDTHALVDVFTNELHRRKEEEGR